MVSEWNKDKIKEWISTQDWYQTIDITNDIRTPGNFDASKRFELINLGDLRGKSVLDVGCNSGQLSFKAKKHGALKVVGVDIFSKRLDQARTISKIMNLNIEFKEMGILDIQNLGQFDIVFCISVVTEVNDLISSLEALKHATKETLYIELALIKKNSFFDRKAKCYLREIKGKRWNLLPNMKFIEALLGDKFKIKFLGKSSRYSLLRCDIKK